MVAGEVKHLANQTAKATEEISAQISAVQNCTKDTVTAIYGVSQATELTGGMARDMSTTTSLLGEQSKLLSRKVDAFLENLKKLG